MNALYDKTTDPRYSAQNNTKPVNFFYSEPGAKRVFLVGDFNHWSCKADPMERRVDGWWFLQLLLPHGYHRYRFVVDDKPVLDPRAVGVALDDFNERASLVAVS